ncbi:hypothetical protein GCM10027570_49440 [Streptomonospora sediminis]
MNTPLFDTSGAIGVGYEGLDIDGFLDKLQHTQVSLLVDIRQTPISRKHGLSKTKLRENLASIGIEYDHAPILGNPKWNRPGFAGNATELETARETYSGLLLSGDAEDWIKRIADAASTRLVALMCFEANEKRCHRYVTLNAVRSRMSRLTLT